MEDQDVDSGVQRAAAASHISPALVVPDEPFGLPPSSEGAYNREEFNGTYSGDNTNDSQLDHPQLRSARPPVEINQQDDLTGMILGHTPESFADASFQLDQFDFMMFRTMFEDPQEHQNFELTSEFPGDFLSLEPNQGAIQGSEPGDLGLQSHQVWQNLPSGLNIGQLDPLEGHRSVIIDFISHSNADLRRYDDFLSSERMRSFLWSYFTHFHDHTPILHLPTWTMATTSTTLIFAMVLIGAKYSRNLLIKDHISQELCDAASRFIWSSYQVCCLLLPLKWKITNYKYAGGNPGGERSHWLGRPARPLSSCPVEYLLLSQ